VESEQICRYAALAKSQKIDAVLSISNQFVALPSHIPIIIPSGTPKGVALFHWSWMYLLTEAKLLKNNHEFERPEQRYILSEMERYFSHPSVGVSTFDRMNAEWKELNAQVQAGAQLNRESQSVVNSVAAWHQEVRDLCLLLARKVKRPVDLRLSRSHTEDPVRRVRDDSINLANKYDLRCSFDVPWAASDIRVIADLQRRSLSVSMVLTAPADKKRSSSRINWILRQLAKTDPTGLHIRALWPGRAPITQASLSNLKENPSLLEATNKSLVPTQFEVVLIRDLAGKFAGPKTFIEHLEEAVPSFYKTVGENLRPYVAPPPKISNEDDELKTPDPMAAISVEAEAGALAATDQIQAASETTTPSDPEEII
jgi:hypothetical protein